MFDRQYENKLKNILVLIQNNSVCGIEELIELYKILSKNNQEIVRQLVDKNIATKLLSYSYVAAVESVRSKSTEKLFNGLIAQAIENARIDWRDNLVILFLLYNSAKRLKENFKDLVGKVLQVSSCDFAKLLIEFCNRNDLDSDLTLLSGYTIVEQPEFNYVWSSKFRGRVT